MRRDVFHYFEKDLFTVFEAFKDVIKDDFNALSEVKNFYEIKGNLKWSFKYNMNGGVFIVHFMPYKTGTAIAIRYVFGELVGARYGAHDKDLISFVEKELSTKVKDIKLDMNDFLKPENMITSDYRKIKKETSFVSTNEKNAFCTQCGNKVNKDDNYCGKCGHRLN